MSRLSTGAGAASGNDAIVVVGAGSGALTPESEASILGGEVDVAACRVGSQAKSQATPKRTIGAARIGRNLASLWVQFPHMRRGGARVAPWEIRR